MVFSTIKSFLSAFIKWSSQATPKLVPNTIQVIQTARKIGAQTSPENIADIPVQMQSVFLGETDLPEKIIYGFKNVVVSWNGVVIKGLQLFVPSLAYFTYAEEYSGTFLLRQWISKRIKLSGTVGLIYDNWSVANYYHWLIDTLPRLLLLREKYPNCKLIIPASAPDYVSLTVSALGFNNTFALAKNNFIRVQHLIMPSHITHPGSQDPTLIQSVREELLKTFGYAQCMMSSLPTRRIYVSRSRQKIRRLLNEEELYPLLLYYDFEIVYFEEMSFEQQVKIMQGASIVMGVHGANLTNILFMSTGSLVIELLNEQIPNPCYFQLASNLELRYQALPCYPTLSSGPVNNNNLNINPASLDKVLKSL